MLCLLQGVVVHPQHTHSQQNLSATFLFCAPFSAETDHQQHCSCVLCCAGEIGSSPMAWFAVTLCVGFAADTGVFTTGSTAPLTTVPCQGFRDFEPSLQSPLHPSFEVLVLYRFPWQIPFLAMDTHCTSNCSLKQLYSRVPPATPSLVPPTDRAYETVSLCGVPFQGPHSWGSTTRTRHSQRPHSPQQGDDSQQSIVCTQHNTVHRAPPLRCGMMMIPCWCFLCVTL